jgi:hypothetical protein
MKVILQRDFEDRDLYLVRVAIAMLKENASIIDTVIYDEAECDAYCLADDLETEFNIDVQ